MSTSFFPTFHANDDIVTYAARLVSTFTLKQLKAMVAAVVGATGAEAAKDWCYRNHYSSAYWCYCDYRCADQWAIIIASLFQNAYSAA
jgi:hypothetical protein